MPFVALMTIKFLINNTHHEQAIQHTHHSHSPPHLPVGGQNIRLADKASRGDGVLQPGAEVGEVVVQVGQQGVRQHPGPLTDQLRPPLQQGTAAVRGEVGREGRGLPALAA